MRLDSYTAESSPTLPMPRTCPMQQPGAYATWRNEEAVKPVRLANGRLD